MAGYKGSKAQSAIGAKISIGSTQLAYTGTPISITGDVTAASASVTSVSSIIGILVGMPISGTGIPVGATIAAVSGSTITLSAVATAGTGSSESLTVTPWIEIEETEQAPVSGYQWDNEQTTNFDSLSNKEWIKTLLDSGKVALQTNRVSSDPGQVLLYGAFLDPNNAYMFQISYPLANGQTTSGDTVVFAALVNGQDDDLTVGKVIKRKSSMQRTGAVTFTEGS